MVYKNGNIVFYKYFLTNTLNIFNFVVRDILGYERTGYVFEV